jgi:hypothetical protein
MMVATTSYEIKISRKDTSLCIQYGIEKEALMCLMDSPKPISARTSTPLKNYSHHEPTTHRQFGSREELPSFSPFDYADI